MTKNVMTILAAILTLGGMAMAEGPQRVEIGVVEPVGPAQTGEAFPVAVGLVFPEGELGAVPGGRLVDDRDQAVAFEAEATGWWNAEKSSIKWLLLRFKADAKRRYFFVPGPEPIALPGEPLAVEKDGDILINTGPLHVRLTRKAQGLFKDVKLNGHAMLLPLGNELKLLTFNGNGPKRMQFHEWSSTLEEATSLYASVKATAYYYDHSGNAYANIPVAKLDLRYEFFRGESFVRVYHTLTWMTDNFMIPGREISVNIKPKLVEPGTVSLGTLGTGGKEGATVDTWKAPWTPSTQVLAQQDTGNHFALSVDGKEVAEGRRLGGWIGLEGEDGRGVSVSLRHAWQTYPTAFEVDKGEIQIQLWPRRGPFMSFKIQDLMGDEFYNHPVWKSFKWTKDDGHAVHQRARMNYFHYTPEGAARTHELTFQFYDKASKRSPQEMNSFTQHPLVLRQDPASAMRVPFMGFRIMPVNKEKYPNIERAVDTLGRMAMGRWVDMHEYGLWRFGLTRWGFPANSHPSSLYRWIDGSQYDQQLIPWLLYMRGGDRRFFEDAEITSRYLMDVGTNHYNSRGHPTGYMTTAGITPFPYVPYHTTKGTKIHFLSYYYHLTGYKRAKEVMDEVIAGTLETAAMDPAKMPAIYDRTAGRETYNMNVFWVNAYQETWDPKVADFAKEWKDLSIDREYSQEVNEFRPPRIYLYNGLVLQHGLWQEDKMKDVMLRNLAGTVLVDPEQGSGRSVENMIGAQWAYDQTQDVRYGEMAWDLAQSLADSVPEMDFTQPKPPPYFLPGNSIYRQSLLPILVGVSLADELGLKTEAAEHRQDTFFSLHADATKEHPGQGVVAVRPKRDGKLRLFVRLSHAGDQPVTVKVTNAAGDAVLEKKLVEKPPSVAKLDGAGYGLSVLNPPMDEFVLPNAKRSEVYRLQFDGAAALACAVVFGDAQIVHYVPEGKTLVVHDLGGVYYGGARFYTKTNADTITVIKQRPARSPYVIRDAKTWELLYRSNASDATEQQHKLGKDRLIVFITADRHPHSRMDITGTEPWFSATREGWFDPEGSPAAGN